MGSIQITRTTSTEISRYPRSSPLARVNDPTLRLVCRLHNAPVVATCRRVQRITADLLTIPSDCESTIISIFHLHVEGVATKTVRGAATPVVACTGASSRDCVQCSSTTTSPIGLEPIHFETIWFVILTIVAVLVTCETSANSIRGNCINGMTPVFALLTSKSNSTKPPNKLKDAFVAAPPSPWIDQPPSSICTPSPYATMRSLEVGQ